MTSELTSETVLGDERIIRYPDGSVRPLSQISIGMLGMCTLVSGSVLIATFFCIF